MSRGATRKWQHSARSSPHCDCASYLAQRYYCLLLKDRMSFAWSPCPFVVQDRTKSLCLMHIERLEMKSPLPEQWISLRIWSRGTSISFKTCKVQDLVRPTFLFSYLIFSKVCSASLTRPSMTICSQDFILLINVQSILCPPYLQPRLRTPCEKLSIEDPDWRVLKALGRVLPAQLDYQVNTSSTCLHQGPHLILRP